jgi:hypothetical protein
MKFFAKLVVPPLVLLPVMFLVFPTVIGALIWQLLSTAWLMVLCINKGE